MGHYLLLAAQEKPDAKAKSKKKSSTAKAKASGTNRGAIECDQPWCGRIE